MPLRGICAHMVYTDYRPLRFQRETAPTSSHGAAAAKRGDLGAFIDAGSKLPLQNELTQGETRRHDGSQNTTKVYILMYTIVFKAPANCWKGRGAADVRRPGFGVRLSPAPQFRVSRWNRRPNRSGSCREPSCWREASQPRAHSLLPCRSPLFS
jgi:hypothetical protein